MPNLDTILKEYVPKNISPKICGGTGCTYTFNLQTGCYDLQKMNCGTCSCAPQSVMGKPFLSHSFTRNP